MPRQPKEPLPSGYLFAEPLTEALLHFIWRHGYFNKTDLQTTDGEAVEILHPGTHNHQQGPDFSAAKIRIGGTLLAGHVELHLHTSDWNRHGHGPDPRYRNVVLHVVHTHDAPVNDLPVLELGPRIPRLLLERYRYLMDNAAFVPCGSAVGQTRELVFTAWKERLLVERLARRAQRVLHLLEQANGDWEQCTWWLVARAVGGKVNGDAFEAMARTLPLTLLSRHRRSIHQLEALLFGQAGMLDGTFLDDYPQLLQREYRFLQTKYSLPPSTQPVLFLRMRPGSFPTLRLAQLAALLQNTQHLFAALTDAAEPAELLPLFSVTANDYWHYRYTFDQPAAYSPKTFGTDAVHHLLINTVVPLLFAHGLYHGREDERQKALRWLQRLPPENNNVLRGFGALGVENRTAFDSQALLELKASYCQEKRCLDCAVGNSLLKEAAHEYGRKGGEPSA